MERRVVQQMAPVLESLHRLHAARDSATFPELMMSVIDEVIPCVNLSFDIIEIATGVPRNGFLRPTPMTQADFMERWAHLHREHPGIVALMEGSQAPVLAITDFFSQRQFRERALYAEIFRPLGISHQLGLCLPTAGHVVGIALNRDRDFSQAERRLVELLRPHVLLAFQRTQLFTTLAGAPPLDFEPWRRHKLTRRECDVLQWLMEGKRNREIALLLRMRPRTVDTHVVNLFTKLGVQTRTAAANRARELLREG